METIEQLNANWESQLTNLDKQLWENLKAQGVTARWEDAAPGEGAHFVDTTDDGQRLADPDEFFEFVVLRDGKEIARHTKDVISAHNLVIIALTDLAKQMEQEGVHFTPS